eukprot:Hpha_TRINITY_DN15865_c4_g10::TRINITY_DN15865_c4_g10_i1::g.188383::m.188383/K10408/DNAH; dynein heavy chain, axonemal
MTSPVTSADGPRPQHKHYPPGQLPPIEGQGSANGTSPGAPGRKGSRDWEKTRLRNAHDAIGFFSGTSKPPFKFVYANKDRSSLTFRPYDLLVVLRGEQEPEHWVVSMGGVVQVRQFEPPELFTHEEWSREARLFDSLTHLHFFRNYLVYKAFKQWRQNVRYSLFLHARTLTCKRLFLSKHTFARPLQELHSLAFDLQAPPLIAYPTQEITLVRQPGEPLGLALESKHGQHLVLTGVNNGAAQRQQAPFERMLFQSKEGWRLMHCNDQPLTSAHDLNVLTASSETNFRLCFGLRQFYELKQFREEQAALRDEADAKFNATMQTIREALCELCSRVSHDAHVPDLTTMEKLERYISAHSMVPGDKGTLYRAEREAEKQERKRALKKVMVEYDFLGNLIRLCDYMVTENLFKSALSNIERFVAHETCERPRDLLIAFEITCQFDAQRNMVLAPSQAQLMDTFRSLLADDVKEVDEVVRLPRVIEEQVKERFSFRTPELTPLEKTLSADYRFLALKDALEQILVSCFDRATQAAADYKGCKSAKHFIEDEWKTEFKRWQADKESLQAPDFMRYIKKVKAGKAELEKMAPSDHGILHINIKKLTVELIQPLDAIQDQIKTHLLELAQKRALEISKQSHERGQPGEPGHQPSLETMRQRLEDKRSGKRPSLSLNRFADWVKDCNVIYERQPKVQQEVKDIQELFNVADAANFPVLYTGMNARQDMADEIDRFNSACESSRDKRRQEMPGMVVTMRSAIDEEIKKHKDIISGLKAPNADCNVAKSPARFVLDLPLDKVRQELRKSKAYVDTLNDYQILFEQSGVLKWDEYEKAEKLFTEKVDLWTSIDYWDTRTNPTSGTWWDTEMDKLEMPEVKKQTEELYSKAYKMEKAERDSDTGHQSVTKRLLESVATVKQTLPVMEALGNKALKDRHWEKIFEDIQKTGGAAARLKVPQEKKLKNLKNIYKFEEVIQQVSSVATGEWAVQRDLDQVKAVWEDPQEGQCFFVKNHREQKDVFIIGGLDETIEKLEDNQVTVQTCLASRWAKGIRADVEEWETKLATTADVLDEWVNLQKSWMYLEFIFSSDDIKKQLPNESRLFASVDKDFRALMKRAHDTPQIIHIATDPEVLPMLKKGNENLDLTQKKLEEYLETKRVAFPRFYFLSNDELLEILSDVRNPMQVTKHLNKCFDGMKTLEFANPPDNTEISAMVSNEGEKVPFSNVVKALGQVEHWLTDIERNMKKTLYDCTQRSWKEYPENPRAKWYFEHPSQVTSCVDQIYWTAEVEEVWKQMGQGDDQALVKYIENYHKEILKTVELVKLDLTKLQRTLVCTLLVVDVHAESVMQALDRDGCHSYADFNWQKQLRYYWTNKGDEQQPFDCWIGHGAADILYAYEYLGNQPRLVITQLTERAFLTCTGALHMNLGAAPQGPAGTGKTESVKDLGKALARQVVVFNCSDGLNYKMMSQMFAGLAQAGAWACFDEFNRIDIEVLSVVAQQMLEITLAIGEGKDTMKFDGHDIRLNRNFGVFITMNPGYAGRTELPDNLKALFRPICMMIPDYALIAEIMFYSEGYGDSKSLAQKMVQLYNLSSQQLSKQDHYDFGMRAVKSILVMAGSLKRGEPDADENMLLIRAMRDANVPKFLRDDTTLFMALISDLFPSVEIEDVINQQLMQAMEACLIAAGKQVVGSFVEKVMQLYETMVVRHGVMLVGASLSGKTTNAITLKDALCKLKKDNADPEGKNRFINLTTIWIMNPKSISMAELYGDINPTTREWADGVLSHIARVVVDPDRGKPPNRHWIDFDGPVDAIWIENMNTVLDDNKLLCLVNGERIKVPDTVSIMFEVQDLRVASPATVSRCGMVFMEPFYLDGGWRPLAVSFSQNVVKQGKLPRWRHERLVECLEAVVPSTLEFFRTQCSEYIFTIDAQLVVSLCKLLEAYVLNWDAADDGDDCETVADEEGGEAIDIGRPPRKIPPAVSADDAALFDKFFIMSYIWSLGGNVADKARQKMSEFMLKTIHTHFPDTKFPSDHNPYHWIVHKKGNTWVPWDFRVPNFRYNREKPYFEMIVPTQDTAILTQHISYLLSVNKHVLISGVTGVGKSAAVSKIITSTLKSEDTNSDWQSCGMSFSAQTSSVNLQEFLEASLNKKKNTLLGAQPGKRCVLLVDDCNMPEPEKYGASPPLELLRQIISRSMNPSGESDGGLYDRKKKDLYKHICDVITVACCGPPGGGKHEITPRLTTHFHCLVVPQLSNQSMTSIFTSILQGFLSTFASEVSALAKNAIAATVEIFDRISTEMLPTPMKMHYTFNLRDLSKVIQGVLMLEPKNMSTATSFAKVFSHECSRVFHDRLINQEDRDWWWQCLAEVTKKHFKCNHPPEWSKLLFGSWADTKSDAYQEISDMEKVQDALADFQKDFGVALSKESDLVMFDDAVQHLTRLCRILRQPRGNALLVGVGGSGRHSLTELAAFICDQKCYQIAISRGYELPQFREDVKTYLLEAGCSGKHVVFLFADTQIVKESFLEDINNVLNVGEIPNIYLSEDYERIINSTRDKVSSDNRLAIIRHYVGLVRDNLHVIFAVSPIGDQFRNRLRMFPSLVNCMTIDWYTKWPKQALMQVATRLFSKASGAAAPAVKENSGKLAEMCVTMHVDIENTSEDMWNALKRRNYTTPTSYLSLIESYLTMFEEASLENQEQLRRYNAGLDKLATTSKMVEKLKKEIQEMQPKLDKASREADKQEKEIAKAKEGAEKVKEVVQVEEKKCQGIMAEAQAIEAECKEGLDKAMPAFHAAQESLKTLDKKDLDQIKSYATPPEAVEKTMNSVILLLGAQKLDWKTAKQHMSDTRFFKRLEEFDPNKVEARTIKRLQPFVNDPGFTPDQIGRSSAACQSMCSWAHAINNYYHVTRDLKPKQAAFEVAQKEGAIAKAELETKQKELQDVEDKVDKLERDKIATIRKKESLEQEKEIAVAKLGRADQLLGGLAGEAGRWKENVRRLEQDKKKLIGTMILAAGCVAYVGPFPSNFRINVVNKWTQTCDELRIPVQEGFSLDSITDAVTVRQWSLFGLPTDTFSVENGTILSRSQRWCLMIDPQGQANSYIKRMERAHKLRVLKMGQDKFMQQMEQCIRIGVPVLIENIGEELDASLDPILLKQTFIVGGRKVIKLGDQEVDYDDGFRLHLTTKMPNPSYTPELQIKVAIVNFTVTTKGLEEQLLSQVVQLERADLAEKKDQVVVQIADGKAELKGIEDKILKMLADATGDILDNRELIQTLADSKVTSDEVSKAVEEAEATSADIQTASEEYRPVATRGSLLYATMCDIANIDHMYQYSLGFWKELFGRTIEKTPGEDTVTARVGSLMPTITRTAYSAICRGLFEKDKPIYSFIMCGHIFRDEGKIQEEEWSTFLRGSAGQALKDIPCPSFIEEGAWRELLAVGNLPGLEFLLEEIPSVDGWADWMKNTMPQDEVFPGKAKDLNEWHKLLIVKALRPEKSLFAIPRLVRHWLGKDFTESPPFNVAESFADSTNITPIIFVLSTGTDPTATYTGFAKEMGFDPTKLPMLSLGQDQGNKAAAMIEKARQDGEWVYLQNCHVYTSWMPTLDKILEDLTDKATSGMGGGVHPDFRLWLTSMPSNSFPVPVLQAGLKLTKEPPKGLRANLKDSFNGIEDSLWDEFEGQALMTPWKCMIFTLVFSHAIVQERRKFGSLGWNIAYEWSNPDLSASIKTIRQCITAFDEIPWAAVKYTIGVINYGGRVTDFLDDRLLQTFIRIYFTPDMFQHDTWKFDTKGDYRMVNPELSRSQTMSFIEELPLYEDPPLFGLPANASITFQAKESLAMVNTIIAVQPKAAGGGGGGAKSTDEVVMDMASDFIARCPEKIDKKKAHPESFRITDKGAMISLGTVLSQEIDLFNRLLKTIMSTLKELQLAIKGIVVLSADLEKMYNSFLFGRVPPNWEGKVGYLCLKPLAPWYIDMIKRIEFISDWCYKGLPSCYWVPGFFFPQGFFTGVLQTHSR